MKEAMTMILKMKQRTTKIRRYLVKLLGGELREDYVASSYHKVRHTVIQYDKLATSFLIDDHRTRLPNSVYEQDSLRRMAMGLKPYVKFTRHKALHQPDMTELRAELWVVKYE